MSRPYISEKIRQRVAKRAENRYEYCRVFDRYSFLSFHIEHIISLKHGGSSEEENLAYSCPIYNVNKGSDIATYVGDNPDPVRFFHPRKDDWDDHFDIASSGLISAKTEIGQATIEIFDLNHPDSIIEMRILIQNQIF
ncbi:MAG: HNH endonuclease [Bacteroidota bacterium]